MIFDSTSLLIILLPNWAIKDYISATLKHENSSSNTEMWKFQSSKENCIESKRTLQLNDMFTFWQINVWKILFSFIIFNEIKFFHSSLVFFILDYFVFILTMLSVMQWDIRHVLRGLINAIPFSSLILTMICHFQSITDALLHQFVCILCKKFSFSNYILMFVDDGCMHPFLSVSVLLDDTFTCCLRSATFLLINLCERSESIRGTEK